MPNHPELNIKAILKKATEKLADKHPQAQAYLFELSEETIASHLTPTQIREIAKNILEKTGFRCTK